MEMDEEELKKCLKIHGYVSSNEEESDSDCSVELDEIYRAFKPSPIQIDPKIHNIIEIGAPKQKKVDKSVPILNTQNGCENPTKKKRKRKKKKKGVTTESVADNMINYDNLVPPKTIENNSNATRPDVSEDVKPFNETCKDNLRPSILNDSGFQKNLSKNLSSLDDTNRGAPGIAFGDFSMWDTNIKTLWFKNEKFEENQIEYNLNYPQLREFTKIDPTDRGCVETTVANVSGLVSAQKLSKGQKRRMRKNQKKAESLDKNTERTEKKEIEDNWELVNVEEELKESTKKQNKKKRNRNKKKNSAGQGCVLNLCNNLQFHFDSFPDDQTTVNKNFSLSYFDKTLENLYSEFREMYKHLCNFIYNSSDSLEIRIKMQLFLKKFEICQMECISWTCVIISNIALLYETFTNQTMNIVNYAEHMALIEKFLYDAGALISAAGITSEYGSGFVYHNLNFLLLIFVEDIITEISNTTREKYPGDNKNFLNTICKELVNMLHWGQMAEFIRSQQAENFLHDYQYLNFQQKPITFYQQDKIFVNETSLVENSNQESCYTSNEQFEISESQTQLSALIIEDLTQNRRHFYSGEAWRRFQTDYLNLGESHYSPISIVSIKDREIHLIEYPLLCMQQSCDLKSILKSLILLIILKKVVFYVLYYLVLILMPCFFSFIDVAFLILLLLYLCTFFVIKL